MSSQLAAGRTDKPMSTGPRPSRRGLWLIVAALVILVVAVSVVWFRPASPAELLAAAQRALDRGKPQQAIVKARELVACSPESQEGWRLLARAGYLVGDPGVWEPALDRLERASPDGAFALWLEIGGEEMQRLRAASAERALRRAVAILPDRPEPWRLLAQLVSVQGRPRETAECLLALLRLGDFTSSDLHTLAWPNSAVDDPTRVEALLEADPDNLVPLLARVGAALNKNRTADAEQLLKAILQRHPENSRANALLGRLLADRDAEEFPAWQRSRAQYAAVEPEGWVAQGIWLRKHGQPAAAARCIHRALELDPRHPNVLSELGYSLQALGNASVAQRFLEWGRLQQEVTELAKRVQEQGTPVSMQALIEQLERVGRLWEAWAWCRAYEHAWPGDGFAAKHLPQLKSRLTPDLPRTLPEVVPGRDFDWSQLPEPDWSQAGPTPAVDDLKADNSVLAFEDDARRLGMEFHFENGPATGQTIAQTSGGGVAAVDYDRDGWCDVYFTQGGQDPAGASQSVADALYRNLGGEAFQAVTLPANLHEDRFSQGVAAGDFDNDGFPDLYVANLGQNRLWRNNGDGTFTDATEDAGLKSKGWTTSCAIADLDGDGHSELFSVRYAGGPEITTRVCRDQTGRPTVCRPTLFPAEDDLVALNRGDGQFVELCGEAGLDIPDGRGFGLVVADFNEDSRLDVFVANDQTANFLLIQQVAPQGQLRFHDDAIVSGVAFDRDGFPQACMGVASGDVNGDGRTDLFITNFADEANTLYVSQPYGGYLDMTREARLRDPGFANLGFGTQFLDADLDGRLDLVVLNGHIREASESEPSPAMLPQLFRGLSGGRFAEVLPAERQSFFATPRIGRGLCTLDWNRDGRPDFAGSFLDGNAVLATNRSRSAGHWLAMEFVGVRSSRDAVGTRVRLTFADGTERSWQLTAGDGFAASNQRQMQLGLGAHTHVAAVEIVWPSGASQRFSDVGGDARWVAVEGRAELLELSVP